VNKQSFSRLYFALLLLLFAALACNVGSSDDPTPTPIPESTEPVPVESPTVEEPAPTEAPELPDPVQSNQVGSLDDLQKAVIQVVAQGSFVDPEFGQQLNVAGSGSGFIISEDGIAVTNNHVVTGAALLRVYVGGESKPVNAQVLAVSECSDLAVIDLEGGGYPYLAWYDEPISTGLQVYAAGFPLGDPEFTLTSGIVAKEQADGETWWASVDNVLMHDAIINPGNSGGPLVTIDGQVVGVNYGVFNENQYMAIARDEALAILDQLRQRQDVTSIGVNGSAVYDEAAGITGIWVSSVESGSPADNAGIREGDIITKIEGLVLAIDGTMEDYCDILRSHNPSDTLSLEILRYDTSEVLEGQLNGTPLAVAFSFANQAVTEAGPSEEGEAYSGFVEIADESNTLVMEVPEEWATEIDGAPFVDDNGDLFAYHLEASSNLTDFWETYSTPGVSFSASSLIANDYTPASFLDEEPPTYECTYDGRFDYDDGVYSGVYDWYYDCGNVGSVIIELAAKSTDGSVLTYLVIQAVSDADVNAADHILNTFFVIE